jgi:hypothetical protein
MDEFRRDWDDYLEGIAYKTRINLFHTVNRNERFYAGRHWEGVDTAGLPQVMLPLVERVVNWKVVQVMSEPLSMIFSAETAANGNREPEEMKKSRVFTDYAKTTWERLKQDSLNERALLDAALSGDAIAYFYWNDMIDAGNGAKGDISEELIDNVNYFPGDTTDPRPNDEKGPIQPYIILAFRKQVEDVKREAMRYGASESDLQNITADEETEYQAGDRARDEHCSGTKEGGKCTVLLRRWREYVEEPETDAMGSRCSIPWGSRYETKNHHHGAKVGPQRGSPAGLEHRAEAVPGCGDELEAEKEQLPRGGGGDFADTEQHRDQQAARDGRPLDDAQRLPETDLRPEPD